MLRMIRIINFSVLNTCQMTEVLPHSSYQSNAHCKEYKDNQVPGHADTEFFAGRA